MLEEREAKPPRLLLRARRPAVKLLSCCAASRSDLHAYTFLSQPGSLAMLRAVWSGDACAQRSRVGGTPLGQRGQHLAFHARIVGPRLQLLHAPRRLVPQRCWQPCRLLRRHAAGKPRAAQQPVWLAGHAA